MTLLETISSPSDLRRLSASQLTLLSGEIRDFLLEKVSRTGGHLGPNLGVVELSIALHRVFDSPRDRIVWDTGHQSYVHKILTGRRDAFDELRQPGGLSGYPSREESEHDIVESSHASTSLSWADGLARAYRLRGVEGRAVVAVIGDGAMTGGMPWEALNNLAAQDDPVIILLNDNGRSYAATSGGFADHLTELRAGMHRGGSIFERLGLAYLGPIDGHNVEATESALHQARRLGRSVVVHCVTEKGRGYRPAETNELDRCHAIRSIDITTGKPLSASGASWTSVFGDEIVQIADERDDVVAITAAMLEPTGLLGLQKKHPDRVLDVGIAEQHAVTLAAGLASGHVHPVVAIYATFVNRALDQALMEVALHNCPVTFVLDRAGITGDDGPSHNGMWDLSLTQVIPGLRVAAPRDGARLRELLGEAVAWDEGPTLLRFPKGAVGDDIPAVTTLNGMDVLHRSGDLDVLIVSVGAMAPAALGAAALLADQGFGVTVIDPRWVGPVNEALAHLSARHRFVATVEDNSRAGGIGSGIAQLLRDSGVRTPLRDFGIPRQFIEHGKRPDILAECGLTPEAIATVVAGELGADTFKSLLERKAS